MNKIFNKVAAAAFGALAVGLGVSLLAATAASATTGTAVFNSSTNTPLTGTNLPSTTVFNLGLPTGAACPAAGSTGEQIFSFLVPANTDITPGPGSLTYSAASAPQPDQGAGLISSGGVYFPGDSPQAVPVGGINQQDFVGLEFAPLLNNGTFDYVVTGTQMPTGNALIPTGSTSASYQAGVDCISGPNASPANTEDSVWSCQVTFTAVPKGTGPGQDPNGFVWTPSNCSGTGPALPEAPLALALPLGGMAVLGSAVFINRRRRQGHTALSA